MDRDNILELEHITKLYPGVVALDDISWSLKRGEVHTLVGENGAGKSTLIKCLSGAITPENGVIHLNGQNFTSFTPQSSVQNGIAVIYQELNLVGELSVAENIFLGTKFGRFVKYDLLYKKAEEVFHDMNINIIDVRKKVNELPTAYQQLVEIAKSVSRNTKILVMDEPTSTLTENEVELLFEIIQMLKERGVSIIYISHRLDEIFAVGDRVTVMRDGKYIATKELADTNREELIRLMVGRELKEVYPERTHITEKKSFEAIHVTNENVTDISLYARQGEIVGLAGLVGAGRSEFVRAVFGADRCRQGEIFVNGEPIFMKSPAYAMSHGIGMLPEDRKEQGCFLFFGVDWNITISHLKDFSKNGFLQHKRIQEAADEYIEKLNIKTPFREQLAMNLSGGNQQKVVLAKSLLANLEILIFDEPTKGIDVGAKQEIYQLMADLVNEGKTILMISSDMEELLGMSDRIYVLCEGRVTGELQKQEFSQQRILELASLEKNAEKKGEAV